MLKARKQISTTIARNLLRNRSKGSPGWSPAYNKVQLELMDLFQSLEQAVRIKIT